MKNEKGAPSQKVGRLKVAYIGGGLGPVTRSRIAAIGDAAKIPQG